MSGTGDPDGPRSDGGIPRDTRRLLIGLIFMALLAGSALVSAFLLGRPGDGATVAPGVPVLPLSGGALVVAAAVVFYRTHSAR